MTGYEFFKERRMEKGYSVRQFGQMADITPRMVSYYEAGEKPIECIPLHKALRMFQLLDIVIEDFFDHYYPYKAEMDREIEKWQSLNPIEYNFQKTKKKIYARLAQIKSRGSIEENKLGSIYDMYENFFCNSYRKCLTENIISKEDYDSYVQPIYYQIKLAMNDLPEDDISRKILEAFYKTNYKMIDVSQMCGITTQNLNKYLNGKYDYGSLHTDTALKLCYLLKLDFNNLFSSCGKYN